MAPEWQHILITSMRQSFSMRHSAVQECTAAADEPHMSLQDAGLSSAAGRPQELGNGHAVRVCCACSPLKPRTPAHQRMLLTLSGIACMCCIPKD